MNLRLDYVRKIESLRVGYNGKLLFSIAKGKNNWLAIKIYDYPLEVIGINLVHSMLRNANKPAAFVVIILNIQRYKLRAKWGERLLIPLVTKT